VDKIYKFLIVIFLLISVFSMGYLIGLTRVSDIPEDTDIVILKIYGAISVGGNASIGQRELDSDKIVKSLKKIHKLKSLKALIIRISSPGGTIGAVQEICEELEKLRNKGVKIYASVGDIAASGGYYIACAASKIYVNPGSLIGSIGVIMEFPIIRKLLNKIGVDYKVIKSVKFKDIGSFARDITKEELVFLQNLIKSTHTQFENYILAKRKNIILTRFKADLDQVQKNDNEILKSIANGSIYNGNKAVKIGLCDKVGNLNTCLEDLKKEIGIEKPNIFYISETPSIFDKVLNIAFRKLLNGGFKSRLLRYEW